MFLQPEAQELLVVFLPAFALGSRIDPLARGLEKVDRRPEDQHHGDHPKFTRAAAR